MGLLLLRHRGLSVLDILTHNHVRCLLGSVKAACVRSHFEIHNNPRLRSTYPLILVNRATEQHPHT